MAKIPDGKHHPVSFISRKLSAAEVNYDMNYLEMFTVIFSFRKWWHFLQGASHKTVVCSDHQNLTDFITAVSLIRRQARWAED
jgi:hypothetical protein